MKRFARRLVGFVVLALLLGQAHDVRAAGCCLTCGKPCGHEQVVIDKEILVPQWHTERRLVNVTKMVPERRQHTFFVNRSVPETRQVQKEFDVVVPVIRSKQVREVEHVPVYRDVQQHYVEYQPFYRDVEERVVVQVPRWDTVEQQVTVAVPHVERRTDVRTVCRMVRDVALREVCRDEGHWETRSYPVACGSACGDCGKLHYESCRVWVPNIVKHQQQVPVMRPELVEQPFHYNVTVMRPEQRVVARRICRYETQERMVTRRICDYRPVERTRTVRVCDMQPRERMREVRYVDCEVRREMRPVSETTYRVVQEERTVEYSVCVPRQVQQEVEIEVCRMVPKTIQVPVSCEDCESCGHAAPLFARRRWR